MLYPCYVCNRSKFILLYLNEGVFCFVFAVNQSTACNLQQAFSSEAAAVERGLYLQLGDADAKTESQLGGKQLEAAKRLRQLLSTNRWVLKKHKTFPWYPITLARCNELLPILVVYDTIAQLFINKY